MCIRFGKGGQHGNGSKWESLTEDTEENNTKVKGNTFWIPACAGMTKNMQGRAIKKKGSRKKDKGKRKGRISRPGKSGLEMT
jgi:hypothetical protein